MNDEFYMNLALNYAWETQGLALPNPSVGALVLDKNGKILSLCSHQKCGESHAELLACAAAYKALSGDLRICELNKSEEIFEYLLKNHNGIFHDTSVFVTLEPCNHFGKTPSCAALLCELRPKRVIISSMDSNKIASGGVESLKSSGIEVLCGILEQKGKDLLLPFLAIQKNGGFSLFKVAQRLNGSFKNGRISSEKSQIYSHKLRQIAQRIIISQRTILEDNPLLDVRFADSSNENLPSVCILGRENRLDKNLNIFKNNNREIKFFSVVREIPRDGFSIIEGGAEMFESMRKNIDLLLVIISPKMASGANFHSELGGRILHAQSVGSDIWLWIALD